MKQYNFATWNFNIDWITQVYVLPVWVVLRPGVIEWEQRLLRPFSTWPTDPDVSVRPRLKCEWSSRKVDQFEGWRWRWRRWSWKTFIIYYLLRKLLILYKLNNHLCIHGKTRETKNVQYYSTWTYVSLLLDYMDRVIFRKHREIHSLTYGFVVKFPSNVLWMVTR